MQLDGLPLHVFQSVIACELDKCDLHALRLSSKSNKAYLQTHSDAFRQRMENYVHRVAPCLRCKLALTSPSQAGGSRRLGIWVPFEAPDRRHLALVIGLGCNDVCEIVGEADAACENVGGPISPYLLYIILAWSHGIVMNSDPFRPTWHCSASSARTSCNAFYDSARDAVAQALQADSQVIWDACSPLDKQFEGLRDKLSSWGAQPTLNSVDLGKAARTYLWKRDAVRLLVKLADLQVCIAARVHKRVVCLISFNGRVMSIGRRSCNNRTFGMERIEIVLPLQLDWMILDWALMCVDRNLGLREANATSTALRTKLGACKDALVSLRLSIMSQFKSSSTVDC